MLKRKEK